jgi:asparagine synthetase B (glutamine-hydrolysing)
MSTGHQWSRVELALGMPLGVVAADLTLPTNRSTPREELERIVDEQFESGRQVYVCFSGGRDSSAVLALAAAVARRRGGPLPIPVTLRFPDHPESDESRWQNLVVEHLGLSEWIVIERPDADVLDPAITEMLTARGLFYPSQIGSYLPIVAAAAGGVVLTGEGGDESFGGWQLRPAMHPVEWGPLSAAKAAAVAMFSHGPAAAKHWYRRRNQAQTWLTEAGRRGVESALDDAAEVEPLGWRNYLAWSFARRAWFLAQQTLNAVGEQSGCRVVHPLAERAVLASLASAWPRRGPADRTDVMRSVVGDLLPRTIVEREDKAVLASVFIGKEAESFIEQWDGSGVDAEWIDTQALREVWARRYPYAGSFNLLHQAWLAGA